jgi:nitroreductase
MSLTAREINELKKAPAVDGVLPVFHERWSSRFFADRDVTPETMAKVFEAARWAPSSYNGQPWRYIVGHKGSDTFQKIAASLTAFNQSWAGKAPVLIVGCAATHFSHNGQENRYAIYDLGAATAYLTLQAAAFGLTTHQMAGYDQEKARAALGIPQEFVLGAAIAVGYQGDPFGEPEEEIVKRELAPRDRKPLSEIVFSAWGVAAKLG